MCLKRWNDRDGTERNRPRTAQSFCIPKAEIVGEGYDLSLNRYQEALHVLVDHVPPKQIIADLNALEAQIQRGLAELQRMMG